MSSDPTEMERRRLLPIVNQPAHAAAATAVAIAEVVTAGVDLTDEQKAEVRKDTAALAKEIERSRLIAEHGVDNVFDTDQLREHFDVIGFLAPCVVVTRKSDNKKGSLYFTDSPRLYFGFQPHKR